GSRATACRSNRSPRERPRRRTISPSASRRDVRRLDRQLWRDPLGERLGDSASELRGFLQEVVERALGDDEDVDVARSGDRCGARHFRDERDLAEEIAVLHRVDPRAVLGHLGFTPDQDEELPAPVSLGRHLLACREIQLVGDMRDVLQALLVELREERDLLEELHLGVLVELHRANLSPSGAVARVGAWTSYRSFSARRRAWRAFCWCAWGSPPRASSRSAATSPRP